MIVKFKICRGAWSLTCPAPAIKLPVVLNLFDRLFSLSYDYHLSLYKPYMEMSSDLLQKFNQKSQGLFCRQQDSPNRKKCKNVIKISFRR